MLVSYLQPLPGTDIGRMSIPRLHPRRISFVSTSFFWLSVILRGPSLLFFCNSGIKYTRSVVYSTRTHCCQSLLIPPRIASTMQLSLSNFVALAALITTSLAQTPAFDPIYKPTSGEKVPAGSTYEIVWKSTPAFPGTITIKLIGGASPSTLELKETIASTCPSPLSKHLQPVCDVKLTARDSGRSEQPRQVLLACQLEPWCGRHVRYRNHTGFRPQDLAILCAFSDRRQRRWRQQWKFNELAHFRWSRHVRGSWLLELDDVPRVTDLPDGQRDRNLPAN